MANGLQSAIINPAQADVIGAFDAGRERQATGLAGQILGETFTGKIGALARLSPDKAIALSQAVGIPLDDQGRLNNFMGTAVAANKLVQAGLTQEATQFVTEAADKIESVAGPGQAQRMRDMANRMQSGDPQAFEQLGQLAQAFDPQGPSALDVARTGKLIAETGEIGAPKKQTPLQEAQTRKINAELKQLQNRDPNLSKDDLAVIKEEKIQTTRKNVARISELSQASRERDSAIKKANKFLRAFKTGTATSGATRTAASFVPGVFTSQGAFDEEFNSFAEVAARQQLKAAGEIRPTDADVEGMKRAMFGVGRDEETNINLLTQFIEAQEGLDDELDALNTSKTAGSLSSFTGVETAPAGLPVGSTDNNDGTFTLPDGRVVRRKGG